MSSLKFETAIPDLPGFHADAVLGDSVFEVLIEPRDLRRLRASLMDIARIVAGKRGRRGILVLDEPAITEDRLSLEWEALQSFVRPEVLDHLAMIIHRDSQDMIFGQLLPAEAENLEEVIQHQRQQSFKKTRRPTEAFFDILRVLLIHWVRKSGPLTSKELSKETGFTYPTIANALEKLDPYLRRHSDRRVEISSFPRDAWFKLVAQSETVRETRAYAARSIKPRSPEALLDRLRELGRSDIATGGVVGARHYFPGLDLAGTPRLDLIMHSRRPGGEKDILRRLDPALKPAERGEPPQVVIHSIYRPVSFFAKDEKEMPYADEIECLLDLHEARLESQALEFLDKITPQTKP
jgi:hypothetical protein